MKSVQANIKKCRVCGDEAFAFNYNGLSCESCKSFFRRNASREQTFKCFNDGACEITISTRRFCSKCRLSKCLAIGMRKDILLKRKNYSGEPEKSDEPTKGHLFELLNNRIDIKILSNASKDSDYPPLTDYEAMKIDEVTNYYKSFKEEKLIETVMDEPAVLEWVLTCEEHGKNIVRVAKNVLPFREYKMEDKQIMIRNFMTIFVDMRFAYYYDFELDYGLFQSPFDPDVCFRTSTNVFKEMMSPEFRDKFKNNLRRNNRVLLDTRIRDLLITLSLFHGHKDISAQEALRSHYLEYYYLLIRYLQTKLKTRNRFERHMKLCHEVLYRYPSRYEHTKQFFQFLAAHFSVKLMAEIYEQI